MLLLYRGRGGLLSAARRSTSTVLLFALIAAGPVGAQVTGSILRGAVTDANSAAMPEVEVQISNDATQVALATKTNGAGMYEFPALNPGVYTLTVKAPGFAAYTRKDIVLTLSQRIAVDVKMQLASITQSVEVTGTPTLVNTESGGVAHVVGGDNLGNLPTFGRSSLYANRLVPGGNPSFAAESFCNPSATFAPSDISFNGTPVGSTIYLVNGVVDLYGNGAVGFAPTSYSVQESVVQSFALSAEYGQTSGSVVTTETKAGTNRPHGALWFFHNQEKFNANNFFTNKAGGARSKGRHTIFGLNGGGPVVIPGLYNGRNRTFFFADYEGNRDVYATSFTSTVPTLLERGGDFSQAMANGKLIQIYDPYTTRLENGAYVRDAFAGNVIPASRINTVGKNVLKAAPEPNLPGETNNLYSNPPFPDNSDSFHLRFDHRLTDNDMLFVSYGRLKLTDTWYGGLSTYAQGYVNNRSDHLLAGGYTHIFSPSFVLNIRAGAYRNFQPLQPWNDRLDRSQLGFSSTFAALQRGSDFPYFSNSDMTWLGYATTVYSFLNPNARVAATKIAGRHSVTFGYEYLLSRTWYKSQSSEAGSFSFNRSFTQGPVASTSSTYAGHGVASLLLGTPASGTITTNVHPAAQTDYHGLFIQDDWRITRRLSINAGLRWDYQSPITERYNNINRGIDLTVASPIGAQAEAAYLKAPIAELASISVKGGLMFAGVNGQPRGLTDARHTDFMPRVGFSYQFAEKTVLRAGYGLYYIAFHEGNGGATVSQSPLPLTQLGFTAATSMVTSYNNLPYDTLANPFPSGKNAAAGSSLGLSTYLGQSISAYDLDGHRGHTHQFQVNLQRELPSKILLDLAYVGSRSGDLQVSQSLNAMPDKYLSLGDQLSNSVTNPFYGLISSGTLSKATITRKQLLLPYPHFTGLSLSGRPIGSTSYNSLQASANKRFSQGLQFLASYTWGKQMQSMSFLNANQGLEHVIVSTDRPHRFVVSGQWELPYGKGRRFGANAPRPLGWVLGNWEAGWMSLFQSGQPFGISGGAMATRAIQKVEPTIAKWFDTGAFATMPSYTLTTLSSVLSQLRGDGASNLDFVLSKGFPVGDAVNFRFKAQFFNITNTPQFALPNTTVTSGAFGMVTSQTNQPRWFMLGATMTF